MPPASKRKRAATMENAPTVEVVQPSSRDASEEDVKDDVLREVVTSKRAKTEENDEANSNGHGKKSVEEEREIEDRLEHGESGERGQLKMDEPPPAGQVDPAGYKTNPPPTGRPIRIYADGVFDLFHLGHMRQLQQCKTAFPGHPIHLLVGVTGDKETHRRKGLTVLSGRERAESVRHCKWVDEVIEDCPWIIADAPEFIEKHKIDYIAHDDIPYGADEGDDIYKPIKEAGKFLVTQRTEGLSTTGIITKIVRDYDKYITRQLKRGTPRQELNVSWLKKNELDIKRNMADMREIIRSNWTTTGQELGQELRKFWQGSRPASPARSPVTPAKSEQPSALAHLAHLEIPQAANQAGRASSDFAAGYSLGLLGGVRSWMARTGRTLNDDRESDEDSPHDKSPRAELSRVPSRGRKGKPVGASDDVQDEVDKQLVGEVSPH